MHKILIFLELNISLGHKQGQFGLGRVDKFSVYIDVYKDFVWQFNAVHLYIKMLQR